MRLRVSDAVRAEIGVMSASMLSPQESDMEDDDLASQWKKLCIRSQFGAVHITKTGGTDSQALSTAHTTFERYGGSVGLWNDRDALPRSICSLDRVTC